jgi:ABC-type Fe3+-hydroxamate transport system substrate-binding protein
VVSLVPSVTETLLAWGVEPVACTRFCEQPQLHHVGGTKDPDVAAIGDLAPDLVVLDEEENRREDHDALVAAGLAVHVLAVRDLAGLDGQMAALAEAVGARWEPIGAVDVPEPTRRAWVPIWKRPWMALGEPTYGSAVLRALAVANVAAPDGPYPEVDPETARDRAADLVIAPSEPYPFAPRHRPELERAADDVRFVDGRDLLWWGARTVGALARLRVALG